MAFTEEELAEANWVSRTGHLPAYVKRIAKDLRTERGMEESRAIATAISAVKRWAVGGGDVTPATQAKAARAVAQWESLLARAAASKAKD